MDISKFKIAWKLVFGGMGSVVDYLLDILNKALAALDPAKKEKIQAVLNLARRVLAALTALEWLCPTNCDALDDLTLTAEELERIKTDFEEAVKAWKSPDDETCVDCVPSDV